MRKNKKGAMELSVGAIIILIIAITFLSLGLIFTKNMVGKMFSKFEEQVSQEPEPQVPSLSYPITFSRNPVETKEGNVEAIKISILNNAQKDWLNRQFIRTENMCGKVDGICFIDKNDATGTCNTKDNAKENDVDCGFLFFPKCDPEEKDGKSCLISNINNGAEGDLYCPMTPGTLADADCNPKEGVEVYLTCDKKLMEKPFKRSIGSVKTGEYKTNMLLLRLKSKIPDDQYLCQLRIFAEDKEYMEDLVVKVENE